VFCYPRFTVFTQFARSALCVGNHQKQVPTRWIEARFSGEELPKRRCDNRRLAPQTKGQAMKNQITLDQLPSGARRLNPITTAFASNTSPASKGCFLTTMLLAFSVFLPGHAWAATRWVDATALGPAPGTGCGTKAGYTTIQAAVNAAAPGDQINVCPGTYTEQVTIPAGKDNIRLRSTRRWEAVIKAPAVMVPDPFPNLAFTIVRIADAQNVTILGFTITGPGPGGCGTLHYGVRVDSAGSADILGNHITQIRDNPLSGCQNGVAILVGRQADLTTGSARIVGNVIDNYQKNGPTVSNTGSQAEIGHNRVLGIGPTVLIAQNGIQVSGGATAEIEHNFVSGHIYTPQTVVSTGILLFQSGEVLADHNTLTANDVGIYSFLTSGSSTEHNDVRASTFDGIALDSETASVAEHNKVRENDGPGISLYSSQTSTVDHNKVEDNSDSGILLSDSDSNTIGNNEIKHNGTSGPDTTDGIRVDMLSTGNSLHDNHLNDNVTHDCHDDSSGTGTAMTANFWVDNHCETSSPAGLCSDGNSASLETSTTYGWDAAYPWFTSFGDAAGYDWATAYATIDTESLLQLAPNIGIGGIHGKTVSPSP